MKLSHEISESIKKRLVSLFGPTKIVIFGSYATGHATAQSDVDILMLVADDKLSDRDSVLKGRLAIREVLRGKNLPFDFIVETDEAFNRYKDMKGSIQYEIDRQGLVLYERQ